MSESIVVKRDAKDSVFTHLFQEREYVLQLGRTRKAVLETLRIFKDKDILKKYLSKREQEVRNMMISLFDGEQIPNAYAKEELDPLSEIDALKARMAR